jgi:hypothetical protein
MVLNQNIEDYIKAKGIEQEELHGRARSGTESHFGRKVFVRGVVEVSN